MAASIHTDRIRESWQRGGLEGTRARVWLVVRRTSATLLVLALISYCAYLLWTLLWNPKTYFVHLTTSTYRPLGGQPLEFAHRDFNAFKMLTPAVANGSFPETLETPLTKKLLAEKLDDAARSEIRSKDRLIVYLAAHGVVRDGEPYLLCEPERWNGQEEVFRVADLLAALKESPAGTKLLILDAGQDSYNSRTGMAINTFPAALQQAIEKLQDPALWVLCANASLERSHVSPMLRQSVLGYFVSKGLAGHADDNGDEIIRLDELYGFVQPNVSAWVEEATAKNESQTALLLNCEASQQAAEGVELLSISGLPSVTELDVEEDAEGSEMDLRSMLTEELQSNLPPQAEAIAASRLGGDSDGPHAEEREADQAATTDEPEKGGTEGVSAASPGAEPSRSRPAKPEAGLKFRDQARMELGKAWEAAAKLESQSEMPPPSVFAPSLWRELVDRLLWYERFCVADFPPDQESIWTPVIKELQGINRSFDSFESKDAEASAGGNIVDRIRSVVPRAPLKATSTQHVSLALLEQTAKHDRSRALPEKIGKFARDYDALLARENATVNELNALLATKDQVDEKELKNFYEFQLLDLRLDADVPWALVRLALRVRRVGEQAATNLLCGQRWAAETIEAADRARWEGERLILDRTHPDWATRSEARLIEARKRYEQAIRELAMIASVMEKRNQLLSRLPDYVRWAHLSTADSTGNCPNVGSLMNLFALLATAEDALSKPGRESITKLEYLGGQLQEARAALDRGLEKPSDCWRIAAVLMTALPDFGSRAQLYESLPEAEKRRMEAFTSQEFNPAAFEMRPIDDERWHAAREQIELDLELARLAGFSTGEIDELKQKLANPEGEVREKLRQADETLNAVNEELPASIESVSDSNGLEDAEKRSDALADLRGRIRCWLLLGAQHNDRLDWENDGLYSVLNRAAWYDLLVWQSARFRQAGDDAPKNEVEYLRSATDEYRKLAEQIPGQPAVEPIAEPQLSIEQAPEQISLDEQDSVPLTFTVKSRSTTPVWLVAEYNSDLLEIDGAGIASQEALRTKAAEVTRTHPSSSPAMYPYRPDLLGEKGTTLSASGGTQARLVVRRTSNAQGTAKLILKAVSRDTYLRHEVEVTLPGKEMLKLAVDAPDELDALWSERSDGVALHPLPNREDRFAFTLVNLAKVKKTVDVFFMIPEREPPPDPPVVMPSGALTPKKAAKVLSQFGRLTKLMPTTLTVELPASGEAVRVKFTPPKDQKSPGQANLLVSDSAAADKFAGIGLSYGLIVALRDQETKQLTLRRIEIEPQPPRLYLNAIAEYDPTKGLLINVSATNQNLVPPEGMKLSATVEGLSEQLKSQLEAYIKPPTYSATLYAQVAANAPQEFKAYVDVDGYPRAFIFRIPRDVASSGIEPVKDAMDVRIVSPKSGEATYKAPAGVVPVRLEVDAPEKAFNERSDSFVEIGIDSDRDHELQSEKQPPLILRSDRQVKVAAKSFDPDGTLTLATQISDFRLNLPSTESNLVADILGRLHVPPDDIWSDPVEIRLDGAGPNLTPEFHPSSEIEIGTELELVVFTEDLSPVKKVEAVFESIASGVSEEAKPAWEQAKSSDGGTRWVAKLKTDKLPVGKHIVLIRATDAVGNESDVLREEVEIFKKQEEVKLTPEQEKLSKATSVSGQVLYGGQPLAGATVQVEPQPTPAIAAATTDSSGRFSFPKVPPGKYTFKARGRTRGYFRNAQTEIEVPGAPETPAPVILNAK